MILECLLTIDTLLVEIRCGLELPVSAGIADGIG